MRFLKFNIVVGQKGFQCFLGSLLAVVNCRIQVGFIALHQPTGRTKVMLALDQPLPGLCALFFVHKAPFPFPWRAVLKK